MRGDEVPDMWGWCRLEFQMNRILSFRRKFESSITSFELRICLRTLWKRVKNIPSREANFDKIDCCLRKKKSLKLCAKHGILWEKSTFQWLNNIICGKILNSVPIQSITAKWKSNNSENLLWICDVIPKNPWLILK